jgi:lipopolysaccharide biosynthesis regulator YciM
VPYWFLALASGVLPARVLLQHMLEEDRRRKDSPRRCARCEYDLQAWHRWCPECGERVHDGPPLPRATHA